MRLDFCFDVLWERRGFTPFHIKRHLDRRLDRTEYAAVCLKHPLFMGQAFAANADSCAANFHELAGGNLVDEVYGNIGNHDSHAITCEIRLSNASDMPHLKAAVVKMFRIKTYIHMTVMVTMFGQHNAAIGD